MSASDTLMFREAHESAEVVARQFAANEAVVSALAASLRAAPPRFIVTCARGSSDHAAAYAKYVFETQLGIVTASASPSVTSVYAAEQRWQGALFIAISQSGKSPDLLRNAQAAKVAGARVVALVNVEDSPLAALADTVIPLHAGPERSVAATKSYIAALAAVLHLCARWRGDAELAAALARLARRLACRLGRRLVGAERRSGRCARLVRGGSRLRSRHRAGSGAEVQGNLRPACRGIQRGRSPARPDGPGRAGFPGALFRPGRRHPGQHAGRGGRVPRPRCAACSSPRRDSAASARCRCLPVCRRCARRC